MFEIGAAILIVVGLLMAAEWLDENRGVLRMALLAIGLAVSIGGGKDGNLPLCFVGLVILVVAGIMFLD